MVSEDIYLYFRRMAFLLRKAEAADVPVLRALIEASVRGLQQDDYTPAQRECALATVYGVDSRLIADGTYFVVEAGASIVACGGWSRRKTLFGGDNFEGREDLLLDPLYDAAKIRAFFVHPDWARRGLGTLLLQACEAAAAEAGLGRCEMGATLTGVALYRAHGYRETERIAAPLANGETLAIVRMSKQLSA